MKKLLVICFAWLCSFLSFGQTAANFNCNDCSGANHDLFSELNAGKVVVICWVMPCASCIGGALAAQAACSNFATSNPGQVLYYCADDVANTTCATLTSWCANNGISPTAAFSNAAVDMSPYGAPGMPKVVVLGDANYTVYYNQNDNSISTSGIHNAITSALAAIATGVNEVADSPFTSISVHPNPSNSSCSLSFALNEDAKVKAEIMSLSGQKVADVITYNLVKGDNTLNIPTAGLANGSYFINLSVGENSKKIKLVVLH